MLSASFSTNLPSLPFSPQPKEYTSPALVKTRTWSVPLATAVARPASESGDVPRLGVPADLFAFRGERVQTGGGPKRAPAHDGTVRGDDGGVRVPPVDKSTAALDPRFTGAGFDSASGSSLFARRPSTPSSFTPQEYTRPPCTMASVCMPPHATFKTGKPAGTTVSSEARTEKFKHVVAERAGAARRRPCRRRTPSLLLLRARDQRRLGADALHGIRDVLELSLRSAREGRSFGFAVRRPRRPLGKTRFRRGKEGFFPPARAATARPRRGSGGRVGRATGAGFGRDVP